MSMQSTRRLTLSLLATVFLLANLLLPAAFCRASAFRRAYYALMETVVDFCVGGLVAEACLLAIWGALAAQQLKYRLPISAGLVLVAACSYIFGLRIADDDSIDLPVALVILGLSVAMYVGLLVPLWMVRRFSQRRIAMRGETPIGPCRQRSTQFGLRYLLMCPVAVSAIIILLQYSIPRDQFSYGPDLAGIFEILFGAAVFMVFSSLISVPCVWLALGDKRRWPWAVWLVVVGLAGPWLISTVLVLQYGPPPDVREAVIPVGAFGFGLLTTTLLALFLMRLLDYRLVSPPGENPFAVVPVEIVGAGQSASCPAHSGQPQ